MRIGVIFSAVISLLAINSLADQNTEPTVTTLLDSEVAQVDDALALDQHGNLYGSHFLGDSVYKIDPDGNVSVFADQLAYPNGLAVDSQGNIFINEYGAGTIHKYGSDGERLDSFFVDGYPSGLVKDFYSDAMIFTNVLDNSVNKLNTQTGETLTLYQGEPLNAPVGLAFDKSGHLYIGNYVGRQIYRLNKGNAQLIEIATVPDSGTDFPYLAFITYANGSLFGTVYGEHKVYRITPKPDGSIVTVFAGSTYGDQDGPLSTATFAYPAGIVAAPNGKRLYVSEFSGLGHIRQIDRP